MSSTLPRVLLLWPYGIIGQESIPFFASFLAPRLWECASAVVMLDCSLAGIHPQSEAFAVKIKEIAPDIIGISAWSQAWRWVEMTVAALRDIAPQATIIVGGPHVTSTDQLGGADYALTGESEWTFPELVEALSRKAPQQELEQISGFRCANQLTKTPSAIVQDLDALGLPDFDAMLLREYQEKGYYYRSGEVRQAPILATRGCPFTCRFCEAPFLSGRKIRKHSIAYLKELLLHLRYKYDTKHISICDDNFSYYKDYAKQFCEMVLRTEDFAGMTFATPNGLRAERSDPEMWRLMYAAGWREIILAPETGSQRMADLMDKHMNLDIIPGKVQEAHDAGLQVEAFFIMNYPGETDDDVAATAKFIADVPFDKIALHIFKPLPHTPIWRELIDSKQLAPDHIIGRYDEVEWLANGRTVEDIKQQIARYTLASKSISRIA